MKVGPKTLYVDVKNKFDVKKDYRTPDLDWDCTIFGYEKTKNCNLYLFTSIDKNKSKVWIKGCIQKNKLIADENFCRAGTSRTSGQGTIQFKKDNYVVYVNQLTKSDYLRRFLLNFT